MSAMNLRIMNGRTMKYSRADVNLAGSASQVSAEESWSKEHKSMYTPIMVWKIKYFFVISLIT